MYSCTNFGIPLKSTFLGTICKSCSSSTSNLTPNVVGFFTSSLTSISTQIVSSTSLLSSIIARIVSSTYFLTSITMKSNFTFLSIPTCKFFNNDCNSCNEFDARCDILKIKISYDRNSKLCENFFGFYQAIFDGRNEII